jgi:hypothetical protein
LIPSMNKPKQAIDGMSIVAVDRIDKALEFLRQ